jgi:hypothetical protein
MSIALKKRSCGFAVVLLVAAAGAALAFGPEDVPPILRRYFGGSIDGSGATTGQALVKQADGSWKPGTVGASFPLLAPNGTSSAPSYSFSAETSIGGFRAGSGIFGLKGTALLTDNGSIPYTLSAANSSLIGSFDAQIPVRLVVANASPGSVLQLLTSKGTNGTPTTVASGDLLGSLESGGYLGATSGHATAARIRFYLDGAPTDGSSNPGRIVFSTVPAASLTPSDRWSIKSAGHFQGASGLQLGWVASATDPTGTLDTTLARVSAKNVQVGVGGDATGTFTATSFAFASSRGSISANADGEFVLLNNAGTSFTRLDFGGTTSSFPALRRTSAALDCVTADGTAYTTFNCNVVAVGNGSAGSPSITTINNTNRGFFNDTTNSGIGFTVAGTQNGVISAGGIQLLSTAVFSSTAGSAAAPSFTFATHGDRGLYDDTGNSGIGFAAAGVAVMSCFGTGVQIFSGKNLTIGGITTCQSSVTINGESANGQASAIHTSSELLTLSTSGTTTDTAANLLPVGAIILAVECRITTTITTATNWSVGDATTAARFSAANSTLTSGTTSTGLEQFGGSGAAGAKQNAAAKVRITTTGTPGAGAIRITVFYWQFTAPTS